MSNCPPPQVLPTGILAPNTANMSSLMRQSFAVRRGVTSGCNTNGGGVTGSAGENGRDGVDGRDGFDGFTGATGPTGEVGPTGATGDCLCGFSDLNMQYHNITNVNSLQLKNVGGNDILTLNYDNFVISNDLLTLIFNPSNMSFGGPQFTFSGNYLFNGEITLNNPITPIYNYAPTLNQIGYTEQLQTDGSATVPVAYANIYTYSIDPGTWLLEISVKLTTPNKVVTLSISTVSNTYDPSRAESRNVQNTDVVIRLTGIVQLTATSNVYVGGVGDSATTQFNVWKTRIA